MPPSTASPRRPVWTMAGGSRMSACSWAKVNGPYTETLWVDPSTYLPVRVFWNWLDPRAQGPGTLTGDFRWVKPTQDNLALLRVPVPSGFTQKHSGGLPVPGINL